MNRDDDSFLSAYLDGELDPRERPVVESALVSDPELADKLRGLTSLRDLLGSLHRDLPADVTDRVMGRIHLKRVVDLRRQPRHVWLWAVGQSPRAALAAGIAATLLLGVTLAVPLLRYPSSSRPFGSLAKKSRVPGRLSPGPAAGSGLGRTAGDLKTAGAGAHLEAAGHAASESGSRGAGRRALAGASPGTARPAKPGVLEHYRELLDNPNQPRLFRVSDAGDDKALQRVASVVESTTQFGFYKVTIAQGIVIDPRHPGEATVYAALVSAKGLDVLRDRLAKEVPDRVEEAQVDVALVTQLSHIGRVHAFRSVPFGDVLIPRERLALLRAPGEVGPEEMETGDEDDSAPPPGQPTIEQYRSAPIGELVAKQLASRAGANHDSAATLESDAARAARAHADRGAPAEAARDSGLQTPPAAAPGSRRRKPIEDTFVVLVWVQHSRRG